MSLHQVQLKLRLQCCEVLLGGAPSPLTESQRGTQFRLFSCVNAGKNALGAGAITNLQSNDAAKVWNLPQYGHVVWSGPLQIFIIIFSLHLIIGWAPALAGLSVTIVLVPLNALVGRQVSRLRKELIKRTDTRVKAVSEVITGALLLLMSLPRGLTRGW